MRKSTAAIVLCLLLAPRAFAQVGAPTSCSGTVGTASTPITFGTGGPSKPSLYVSITNPGSAANLCVRPNGAAVIGGTGCIPIGPGGLIWWSAAEGMPPPAAINIIADTSSTPYSCWYQ